MHTFTITLRRVGAEFRVVGESSEPGLATDVRVEEPLRLDATRISPIETGSSHRETLRSYGKILGEAVFHGKIRDAFKGAQKGADQSGNPLHVLLSVETADLMEYRWERLCARLDSGWQFLRLQQRTPFSIYLPSESDKRYPAISRADLRALVVVANLGPTRPYGLAPFDAPATVKSIRKALGDNIPATILACDETEIVPGAKGLPTLDEICERITEERPTILHMVCHGKFQKPIYERDRLIAPGETFLVLRKSGAVSSDRPDDYFEHVSASNFIERLRAIQGSRGLPHLTFLCSCESAAPQAEQGLGGLGQRLVRDLGMPAVVAMTEPVEIQLAGQLSRKFYERLREHGGVDLALDEACAGVAGHDHVLIPTLFSRLAGRKLFDEIGPLTTGQWEQGLQRLAGLVAERAPVLRERFDALAKQVSAALEICKRTEHLAEQSDDTREAAAKLSTLQKSLNELCQDFLENSFDHVAKGRPLAVPDYDGRCPFPGLGVFDKIDDEDFRPFFFGREKLTEEIRRLTEDHGFVAVLGGSGTGKSSLVRAGLLEALRKENPNLKAILFPPGKEPLARLEVELAATLRPDILVVDQFEELFTLCPDTEQRKAFLARLLPLRDEFPIVITMRADFLAECAEHDELHHLLDAADKKHLKIIQALKGSELREVMERQASAVHLQFEPGLAARIFEDIESEPGAMPLLQHCLRQLWQFRHGRWLRLDRYVGDEQSSNFDPLFKRVGGVKKAIARTADEVFKSMTKEEKQLCPFVFEQLVQIDTDEDDPSKRRDTRRRAKLSQLTPDGGDETVTRNLVHKMADKKLLIVSVPAIATASVSEESPRAASKLTDVEVAHEALIQSWDRLQSEWLPQARVNAHTLKRIRNAREAYADNPHPENLRLGSYMAPATALLAASPPRLSKSDAEFVRDCRLAEETRLAARDRRQKATILVLSVCILLIGGLALLAVRNARAAERNARDAAEARDEANDRFVRLSTLSGITERDHLDYVMAAHHFIEAAESTRDPLEQRNLRLAANRLVQNVHLSAILKHDDHVTGAAFVPNSDRVLTWGDDGVLKLWDPSGKLLKPPLSHGPRSGGVMNAVVADDGKSALSWDFNGILRLWNLVHRSNIGQPFSHPMMIGARLMEDGRVMSWSHDGVVKFWDTKTQKEIVNLRVNVEGVNGGAALNASETLLFVWTDTTNEVWDVSRHSRLEEDIISVGAVPRGARFIEDSRLAVWTDRNQLHVWNSDARTLDAKFPHDGPVKGVGDISPDGLFLTWASDSYARLWEVDAPEKPQFKMQHDSLNVNGAAYDRTKRKLLTWSEDGSARLWSEFGASLPEILHHDGAVNGAVFLPEDRALTWSDDGTAALWNLNANSPTQLARMYHGAAITGASHRDDTILTWSDDGTARLWTIDIQRPVLVRHSVVTGAVPDETNDHFITWGGYIPAVPGDDRNSNGQATCSVRRWSIGDGAEVTPPLFHESPIVGCRPLKAGGLLIWRDDGMVVHSTPNKEPASFPCESRVSGVIVKNDDKQCLAWTTAGTLFLINIAQGISTPVSLPAREVLAAKYAQEHGSALIVTDAGIYTCALDSFNFPVKATGEITQQISGCAIAPDATTVLFWNRESDVFVWDSTSDRATPVGRYSGIAGAAFSNNSGGSVLIWGRDGTASLVNTENATAQHLESHDDDNRGGLICDNASRLLTWGGDQLRLWRSEDQELVATMPHEAHIRGAALSADGSLILSWSDDGTARFWDAENGVLLSSFHHSDQVKGCRFLGNGIDFVSWTEGNEVHLWHFSGKGTIDVGLITGTSLRQSGQLNVLTLSEWKATFPKPHSHGR